MLLDCDPITGVGQAAIAGHRSQSETSGWQEGWPWLGYTKTAWVVAKDSGRWFHRWLRWGLRWIPTIPGAGTVEEAGGKSLTWAQVRIRYSSPDGVRSSTL